MFISDTNVRRDAQARIADWVHAGGHLWAQVGAAQWDEYGAPCAVLNEAFGVATRDMQPVASFPWRFDGSSYGAVFAIPSVPDVGWRHLSLPAIDAIEGRSAYFGRSLQIDARGARAALVPTTSQVVARYASDGAPAAVHNSFGSGSALFIGGLVGTAYLAERYAVWPDSPAWSPAAGDEPRAVAHALVAESGVRYPMRIEPAGLYGHYWRGGERGDLIFVVNAASAGETAIPPSRPHAGPVQIRFHAQGTVSALRSVRSGPLAFHRIGDEISFTLPLETTDIVHVAR